ncbi:MAG: glycoside hydrolase family 95-like protein [Planctomycetota bacterium]
MFNKRVGSLLCILIMTAISVSTTNSTETIGKKKLRIFILAGQSNMAGHEHGTFMGEMIGIAGLVNEYLLQSVENKIRLFPCWPSDKSAKFTRLRAHGGFIVSAEFKDGRVASATIESVANKKLQILSPWKTIYVNGKKTVIGRDGLVSLNTKPGQVLKFSETND